MILTVVTTLSSASCFGNSKRIIEITADSYNIGYPAVWFSPYTGEIMPVGNPDDPDVENPPSNEFVFWIEPGDPEFSNLQNSDVKIAYFGYKANYPIE